MNKWDLTYLFKTKEDFLEELNNLPPYGDKLSSYQGKLGEEKEFVEYVLLKDEFDKRATRVYEYAALQSDLNKKVVENAAYVSKIMMIFNVIQSKTSFEAPEILALGEEKVMEFIARNDSIKQYKFLFEKLFRGQLHVLDAKREELLANYAPLSSIGGNLYSSLAVADSSPKEAELSTGKVKVTQGNWRSLIQEHKDNEEDRRKIFETLYSTYDEHKNTYANIYSATLNMENAERKSRNYNSILEYHLYDNNIPVEVFTNLIEVASQENASLKKYLKLRKKYLKIDNYRTYDRFIDLASSSKKYTYEEAKELFFNSIKSCPQDFIDKAHEVLRDGFVDVYEQEGKRTGAYSSGQSDLHPFILLNYASTLDDVFTVAHEAGHSIHTLYAEEAQPSALQNYTIFVAEIASTYNEHMLLDYLIKEGNTTKEEKIMLLQKAIDEIYATFYRQTLFAHYEWTISKCVENNEPITYELLSKTMIDLYKQYYDMDIKEEKLKEYVWAYIPHLFYTPFYVYQYATSFAASFALYKNVKDGIEGAFARYTSLLKSGGSKYPVDQARDAGVDFTKKETFMAVVYRLNELVDELERLISE